MSGPALLCGRTAALRVRAPAPCVAKTHECAGGLKDKADDNVAGNVVIKPPGYYGLPPKPGQKQAGSILRRQVRRPWARSGTAGWVPAPGPSHQEIGWLPCLAQVAEVVVASLYEKGAAGKVVETIVEKDAPALSYADLFAGVE